MSHVIRWYGLKDWLLMKAINFNKNRQGLVQVLRTITVKGTTFTRAYWIRPDEVGDKDRVIGGFQNLPQGHPQKPAKVSPTAKVPQEIRDITTAFQENYLKNQPTREAANEAFYSALRAVAIQWDEIPSKPQVNMMRAKMAVNVAIMAGWRPPGVDQALMDKAQPYIAQNNAVPQPHMQSTPAVQQTQPVPQQPVPQPPVQQTAPTNPVQLPTLPKGNYIVSKESKDKVDAFYKTFADRQDFFNTLENAGITWGKSDKPGPNLMQAKMALTRLVEAGLDLNTLTAQPAPTPPPPVDTSSTAANTTQPVPDDNVAPKDESLLEIPDDATPAEKEIAKCINKLTNLEDIKKCALMGLVPEDDTAKDYIIDYATTRFQKWAMLGKTMGIHQGKLEYGKYAPDSVRKKLLEDCADLDMRVPYTTQHSQLGEDLRKYLGLPSAIEDDVLKCLDVETDKPPTNNNNKTVSRVASLMSAFGPQPFLDTSAQTPFNTGLSFRDVMNSLNSAFSNYIPDSLQSDAYTNMGYVGWNPQRHKDQYDVNKEGLVRYLQKLKQTCAGDQEMADEIDNTISLYDEMMTLVGGNHDLLHRVLTENRWLASETRYGFSDQFGSYISTPDAARGMLDVIETQSNSVINKLTSAGYSDEDIMAALSNHEENDYNMTQIVITNSATGQTDRVNCSDPNASSFWNTHSLCYTLMKFQKMRGIDLGSLESDKYMSSFRTVLTDRHVSSFNQPRSPEELLDYVDSLKQMMGFSGTDAARVKTLAAQIMGYRLPVFLNDKDTGDLRSTSSITIPEMLPPTKHTVVSNLILSYKQHRLNESIARSVGESPIFQYYSGSEARRQRHMDKPPSTVQIQNQLDHAVAYSRDYVMGMAGFYEKKGEKSLSMYMPGPGNIRAAGIQAAEKDKLLNSKVTVKSAMNKPIRDVLFDTLVGIVSNIPSMAKNPNYKQDLAVRLGYVPFNPTADKHPSSKKPVVPAEVKIEYTPQVIKQFRQKCFDRAMGTIATANAQQQEEYRKDFFDRFDYKPGEKTIGGEKVDGPVHRGRVVIFNSPFFKIQNTKMWESRFRAEQQRLKDIGAQPECYEELDLFHGAGRSAIGGVIGRDQGWFMGGEHVAAGDMLGPGAYWGGKAGKSTVYCGDNPYSLYDYDPVPETADGVFIMGKVMRGENPYAVNNRSSREAKLRKNVTSRVYSSSFADINTHLPSSMRPLNDCEMAVRNNALILPEYFVDASCRIKGKNINKNNNGEYTDRQGKVIADANGMRVDGFDGVKQH